MTATTCALLFLITTITSLNSFVDASTTDGPKYTLRLPATAKYYPKDIDELVRQYGRYDPQDAGRKLNKPVMKLLAHVNADEGEKYYDFDSFMSSGLYPAGEGRLQPGKLYLPVSPHTSQSGGRNYEGWTAWFKYPPTLRKRQGQTQVTCPPGNSPCTNIQKPGYCCPGGTSCVSIQDTGFGSVGCCPNSQPCGDSLDSCAPGYNKCPSGSGGGCCLPGYICSPQGCLINTSNLPPPTTVTWVSTTTIGLDICQTGYYPCPASLNYGCCQVGYHCGLYACPYNTGRGTPGTEYVAPTFVVGTSGGVIINPSNTITYGPGFSTIDTATITPATVARNNTQDAPKITNALGNILILNNCPNGWLTCGPEFGGGCCRFGRACGVGYCPVPTDTESNSVTGVVTVTTNNGCPAGWLNCPPEVQGGCCPSGYGCGIYNCPATTTQDGVVVVVTTAAAAQKLSPVGRGAGARTKGEVWGSRVLIGWIFSHVLLMY
ncbi:hypothetical protein TWF730_002412 [Orbilia blumenaviensis]|uniref:GPI anchored protein n=1 Tax=Orbilia blumenaviensis TaxID=1796055 RepID=A0AAV9UAQ3_9PEZI